ncbi:acylneuraminate cytidylyltransferase [Shewanella sp. GD03713]|uniref:cytidylyltransferase domain-containing protein n=1 Tax=Shewanella sp. GD03713 TaxID=2975372 RepID=UPI000B342B52|nr:acylneuraminate cytidylyltransferase [Shewanella sp. GD03713]MDH1469603.1 acylneuraminate cytidylyltransferase [Shewanella sp. GD03713]QXN23864.1 acylneuraminate cytidylyltransferase [Shewanella putrefaciens]
MTKILAIIGARLNSSRLAGKHLLPLACDAEGNTAPLISHILTRLKVCKTIDTIELATTADEFNQPLIDWARTQHLPCTPFGGDVNDLMGRLDVIIKRQQPDFIVYICGDCPLIDPDFIEHALKALIASDKDTIALKSEVTSLHEGMSFYAVAGWNKLMAVSNCAMSREHVGYGNKLNPVLTVLSIDDSDDYGQVNHRISVDTQADYRFMVEIYRRWYNTSSIDSIVSLSWVQEQLLKDKALVAINAHVKQKVAERSYAKASIYCHLGPNIGLGHFKRSELIADALQEQLGIGTSIHTYNETTKRINSSSKVIWYENQQDLLCALSEDQSQFVILDFHPDYINLAKFSNALTLLTQRGVKRVGIDKMAPLLEGLDWLFVPSFNRPAHHPKISAGWSNYLFNALPEVNKKPQILVLTGGSDALGYGQTLPKLLDSIETDWPIIWVQGPLATTPKLSENSNIIVKQDPSNLKSLIAETEIILSCYGLSLFESIYGKAATILLPPKHLCEEDELNALKAAHCCLVSNTLHEASNLLLQLLSDLTLRQALQNEATRVFKSHQGINALMDGIEKLLK